jgi:hypothetical protein
MNMSRPIPSIFHAVLRLFCIAVAIPVFALAIWPSSGLAQEEAPQHATRLILKDGSYQLATKYEVKGDRVRYFSSEREEWEELPNSLVDWNATEQYEKDSTKQATSPEAVQLDKEEENDRELADTPLPQVAPGLRIPEDTGVFLFDNFQGEPQLDEIQQTSGDINRNTKSNIFRGAINPIAGLQQSIELEGAHAKVQSHVGVPSLYLNLGPDTPQPDSSKSKSANPRASNGPQEPEKPQQAESPIVPFDRYLIIRATVKGNKRLVGELKRSVTGKVSQEEHPVKTTIDNVAGGWLKITPTEPLAPGEYALVEMEKEGMNLDVWDFGVNPKAPANTNAWKPEARATAPATTTKKDK